MAQQLITWMLVGVAAFLILRHVWSEVEGFIHQDKAGHCAGCGMCEAAEADRARLAAEKEKKARKGPRPAPVARMTPLVPLQTTLPPHLERLRQQKRDGEE